MQYPRVISDQLKEAMRYFPAVLLTGARQVGKSTLVLMMLDNYITLDDIGAYTSAKTDPHMFVNNLKKPVVIDEIQKVPELMQAIKLDIDKHRVKGSYLLTGSANIMAYRGLSDTLAGRIGILELLPLSCKEIASKSENIVDILFSNRVNDLSPARVKTEDIVNQIIKGGYPEVQGIDSPKGRYIWFSSYIRTYIERDVREIGELRKLDKFIRMYGLLAPRSGNVLNKADIARDAGIEAKLLDNYLSLLELVYHVYMLRPYSSNINKRFIKSPKLFFTDSGILSHLFGISSNEDFLSSEYRGNIFETFVFSELLKGIKYSNRPTSIFFYRTTDHKEIDFILERGQKIIAIEVKFSQTVTKEDFRHIEALEQSVNNLKAGFVMYMGQSILPFGKKLFALPVSLLF